MGWDPIVYDLISKTRRRAYCIINCIHCFFIMFLYTRFCLSLQPQMTDIGMTENIGESGLKFMIWFRRRRSNNDKAYTLHCKNMQIKKEWTDQISKLLWQQAFKSKGKLFIKLCDFQWINPCLTKLFFVT